MRWLALDIGGANLKVADARQFAQSYAFALWRDPAGLAQQIRTIISEAPQADHLAITMTGELADCFESKAAGVRHILKAVEEGSDHRHTRVYLTDGRLVTPQVAQTLTSLAAASNWHALARFAGRYMPKGPALLIDVGSTTSDIIPLLDGNVVAQGRTDTERMLAGEMLYSGVERSPICAILEKAPYRGQICPVTQELFATTRDAYLLLAALAEDPANFSTADGKPATKAAARIRMGRMIAAEGDEFNHRDAATMAQAVADSQAGRLAGAILQVAGTLGQNPTKILLSGHGEFLARNALARADIKVPVLSLSQELGVTISRCAPAHALAVLAHEMTAP